MNKLNIAITLGHMAIEHEARTGQQLLQDPKTGFWRIEAAEPRLSVFARLRSAKVFRNTYFRLGSACAAGAIVALAGTMVGGSRQQPTELPIAAPGPNSYSAPETIKFANTSYAIESTDLAKLPPVVQTENQQSSASGPDVGHADSSAGATSRAAAGPIGNLDRLAQAEIANSKKVPEATATAAASALPNAGGAVSGRPPAPGQVVAKAPAPQATNKLPAPLPEGPAMAKLPAATLTATPPRPAPTQSPSAKNGPTDSKEDNKIAVFNEPLSLAKAPQASGQVGVAPTVQAIQAKQGPVELKASQPIAIGKPGLRLLAVQSANAVVVTNPTTRLPVVVNVGQTLPDGSVLKSVDKSAATAVNSRGEVLVLQ